MTSCENGTTTPKYEMELYEISSSTYTTLNNNIGSWTNDAFLKYAKDQTTTRILDSESGDTIEDVRNWIVVYFGNGAPEIDMAINGIEQDGEVVWIARGSSESESEYGLFYAKRN